MATRMQQRRGTASQWTTANPVLAAGEIGFETDTSKFKIGDGSSTWSDLPHFTNLDYIMSGAPGALDTLNELAAALGDDANFATTVTNSLAAKAGVLVKTDSQWSAYSTAIPAGTVAYNSTNDQIKMGVGDLAWSQISHVVHATDLDSAIQDAISGVLEDTTFSGTIVLPSTTSIGDVSPTEIGYLDGVTSSIQTQLNDVASDATYAYNTVTTHETSKADVASPTFSGNVVLPTTTSIGDVSPAEILTLNGVTGAIQTQIDAKLDATTAENTYAPINDPVFTGVADLPATTNIGDVSGTEISYLNGVTSAVQTQLNAKAPIDSPTFTGTVSGITPAMVGLGNVDNTADADKPVSDATQTALDAKLSLSGGTMTGKITLDGDPSQSLHAATKQYVDNTASGIVAKPQVLGATTANIDATYNNGTAGVGATLTHNTNGVFPSSAGGAEGWVLGSGILVKNQTNKAHNGRYYISDMGSVSTPYVLTRCGYCDEADEIPGAYIFVQDGTNAGTGWVQTVADATTFTVGTDNINVVQFSGSGTITAGTNISVSGNEVSVVGNPTFANLITASSGVAFSDGTQTKIGVPSLTPIIAKTSSYTLGSLTERDSLIEVSSSSGTTITIPTDAALNFPVGTSVDILQTGTGQVTIAGSGGVTVNSTPGLKLRTQWSSATLFKRAANTWVVYGDLTA